MSALKSSLHQRNMGPRSAIGAITTIIRMLALPTAITGRSGLAADSLSAPDRGTAEAGADAAGMVAADMDTVAVTVIAVDTADAAVMWDATTMAADVAAMPLHLAPLAVAVHAADTAEQHLAADTAAEQEHLAADIAAAVHTVDTAAAM